MTAIYLGVDYVKHTVDGTQAEQTAAIAELLQEHYQTIEPEREVRLKYNSCCPICLLMCRPGQIAVVLSSPATLNVTSPRAWQRGYRQVQRNYVLEVPSTRRVAHAGCARTYCKITSETVSGKH